MTFDLPSGAYFSGCECGITQKPVGLLRPLIEYSCPPGGVVLDPFMGSGSVLVAAQELGRRAVGIEIDPVYAAAAVERLRQLPLGVTG